MTPRGQVRDLPFDLMPFSRFAGDEVFHKVTYVHAFCMIVLLHVVVIGVTSLVNNTTIVATVCFLFSTNDITV